MNNFTNTKTFNILVYTIGIFVLIGSELKQLAITSFRNYNKSNAKKV